jgi:DNA replicative helicase MCM subunit Mcm2 (Cdc46/Mcm family)
MIRLAKARARLSMRTEIREDDLKEAYTLMRALFALPKE